MSVKYFCDDCGRKLTPQEVQNSLDLYGKHLCSEHMRERDTDRKVYESNYKHPDDFKYEL